MVTPHKMTLSPGGKGMHVETLSGSHVGTAFERTFHEHSRGFANILRGRQFPVGGIARDDRNLDACPFRDGRVVGKIQQSRSRGARVGGAYGGVPEALRSLGGPQACPVHGALDDAVRRALERIGDRQSRHDSGMPVETGNHAAHQVRRNEGAGGIMYQDVAGRVGRQCLEPPMSGFLPGNPAGYGRRKIEPGYRPVR